MENVKLSLLEKISLYWRFEWRYIPKNIVHGIKNMWYWAPVIWKDRNLDDSFFFDILKFKISKMAESNGKNMLYVGSQRNVEIMNTIVRLIEKFQSEYYLHEYFSYVDDEHTFVKIEGTDFFEVKTKNLRDDLDLYFAKYPLLKNRATKHLYYQKNPSADSLGISMGFVQHEKAKLLIFVLLNRNIEKWWE